MKPLASFDRRTFGRRQTDINASVRIGYRVIPCIIKDLSEGGALLEFAEQIDLPVRLWLSWPEQKSEIVCEVRHTRRNTAGVQFTRPQQMGLRPAVEPGEQFAVLPLTNALRTSERVMAATGSDLVAERRRAIRQPSTLVPEPIPAVGAAEGELPRDISTLMMSLRKAAEAIVEARIAQAVPRPLAAARYAGSVVAGPGIASAANVPMPLAACAVATVPPLPPQQAPARQVPGPMAAALFGAAFKGERVCAGHPCCLSVWRNLANLPPRPLPASSYRAIALV